MNIPSGGAAGGAAPYDPNDPNIKWLTQMTESCYAKTAMAGVAGFGLGGMFGLFMASMAYDTPFQTAPAPAAAAAAAPSTAAPSRPPAAGTGIRLPGAVSISPTASPSATASLGQTPLSSLPLRRQLAVGFRDMGSRSYSTAKNFGAVGALFSGIECGIEGLRAKNDMANGVAAGCLTGAILARNAGPQAAAVGCAGFAAFSAAIDAWLRMPKDE